jgi:hypothetical protein
MPWFRSPEPLGEGRRVVEIPDRLTFVGRVGQAGLDEFDAAHRYAREQGWLVEAGKAFSTMLTPAGWRAAKGE